MSRRRVRWLDLALAVAALAVLAGVVLTLRAPHVSAGAPPTVPATTSATSAIIVGDSYFWPLPGNGPSVGVRVAQEMRWQAVQSTIGGTGYLKRGYDGTSSTYGQRLARLAGQKPDVVLIEGGGNDETFPVADIARAALSTIQQARSEFPQARLVVIGPLWSGDRGPLGHRITAAVHAAAVKVPGVTWIDPAGWFPGTFYSTTGPGRQYIGPDRVHENPAGADLLTGKVVAALRSP